jgi:hypothetical protein
MKIYTISKKKNSKTEKITDLGSSTAFFRVKISCFGSENYHNSINS